MTRLGPRFLSRVGLLFGCLLTVGALSVLGCMAVIPRPDLHPIPSQWRVPAAILVLGLLGIGQAVLRFGFRGSVDAIRFTYDDTRAYVFATAVAMLAFGAWMAVDGWNDPEFWRNRWFEAPSGSAGKGPPWAMSLGLALMGLIGLWRTLTTPDEDDTPEA